MRVASMKRISPPTLVQARPVATPVSSVRSATSLVYLIAPRYSRSSSSVLITRGVLSPSATLTATPRMTLAIWRSRERTPASRV